MYYSEEPQAPPWTGITFQLSGHPDHRESYKELHIPKCDAHPCPNTMHFLAPGCPELSLLQASLLSSWNPSQASHPESSWWQATEQTNHTGDTKGSQLYPSLIVSFLFSFFCKWNQHQTKHAKEAALSPRAAWVWLSQEPKRRDGRASHLSLCPGKYSPCSLPFQYKKQRNVHTTLT